MNSTERHFLLNWSNDPGKEIDGRLPFYFWSWNTISTSPWHLSGCNISCDPCSSPGERCMWCFPIEILYMKEINLNGEVAALRPSAATSVRAECQCVAFLQGVGINMDFTHCSSSNRFSILLWCSGNESSFESAMLWQWGADRDSLDINSGSGCTRLWIRLFCTVSGKEGRKCSHADLSNRLKN